MKYYRAKDEFYDYITGKTAIKNELLTEKERFSRFKHLSAACFEIVEHPKNKTYKIFGIRFPFHVEDI